MFHARARIGMTCLVRDSHSWYKPRSDDQCSGGHGKSKLQGWCMPLLAPVWAVAHTLVTFSLPGSETRWIGDFAFSRSVTDPPWLHMGLL